jgi:LytR cell envelope-related transcriptional attenuator
MAPVQVLNNSRRTGLAAAVASEIQAKGWTISLVGNYRGLVSVPTVYYSPGNEAAAKHLASEFSSIERVEPASALGFTARGVTLVLTASWDG